MKAERKAIKADKLSAAARGAPVRSRDAEQYAVRLGLGRGRPRTDDAGGGVSADTRIRVS